MIDRIVYNLRNSDNTAFVINDKAHSYSELAGLVWKYREFLINNPQISILGIIMRNNLETYAMMTATILSDTGYVIINPDTPSERNALIADEAKLRYFTSALADDKILLPDTCSFVVLSDIDDATNDAGFCLPCNDSTAYVLFTSGSTGKPKGVKLTKDNLNAFLNSFFSIPISIDQKDHVLQMFDLTFDVSVAMIFLSLCSGATIYTTDPTKIKYLDVARILTTYPVNIVCLVPSVIFLLKPFLNELHLPKVETLILTAEASTNLLINMLKSSFPNAEIWNLYGPTEATIWCLAYKVNSNIDNELYNDHIPIGKPMPGVIALIMSEENIVNTPMEKGELHIGGKQVAAGYVNDEERNKQVFHNLDFNGTSERFYATGDVVYMNDFGNIMYCGRKDHQVKIQGYRIELNEIEFYARQFTNTMAIAVAKEVDGNPQLFLFVENYNGTEESIIHYLEQKLPSYMVPRKIHLLKQLPINSSSKIDRKKLEDSLKQNPIDE